MITPKKINTRIKSMNILKLKWIKYIAFVLFINVSTSALALPKNKYEILNLYYSDASKTVHVGAFFRPCYGRGRLTGRKTQYVTVDSSPCEIIPKPKPPGVPCEFTTNPHCQNLPTPRPYE